MKTISTENLIKVLQAYNGKNNDWTAERLDKVILENFGEEWYISTSERRWKKHADAKICIDKLIKGWH